MSAKYAFTYRSSLCVYTAAVHAAARESAETAENKLQQEEFEQEHRGRLV